MAKKGGNDTLVNLQAQQLAAQVAQWAAQLEFQKTRFTQLELPEWQQRQQLDVDKFAWDKAQATYENAYKEALVTGKYQGMDTIDWLTRQAQMTGVLNGQQTLQGKLTDAQINQMNQQMKLANDEFLANTTGYVNGTKTFDREKWEASQAMAGWQFLSTLSGPQNAFKQARAIGSMPGGLSQMMDAWAGKFTMPGMTSVGSGGQASLADMKLGFGGNYQYAAAAPTPPGGTAPGGVPAGASPMAAPAPPGGVGISEAGGAASSGAVVAPGYGADSVPIQNGAYQIGSWSPYTPGNPPITPQGNMDPASYYTPMMGWAQNNNGPDEWTRNSGDQSPMAPWNAFDRPVEGVGNLPLPPGPVAPVSSVPYTYSPAGVQAPANAWNYSPTPAGSMQVYPPGTVSPYHTPDVSTSVPISTLEASALHGGTYAYPAGQTDPSGANVTYRLAPTPTAVPEVGVANSGMLLPNQINAKEYGNSFQYQKDLGWANYEDQGWDKGLAQEAFARSLPKYGFGATQGRVTAF
jgi:hypothetical protein